MRILIIEDHDETRRMVLGAVRESGDQADGVGTLEGARESLKRITYGAIILDWMLPDGAGIDLCRDLRAARDTTPILILTARGDVGDRVVGLDAGADDYLRKPFAVAELLARIRALKRRGPRLEEAVIRLGEVEVRIPERRAMVKGREVPLTAREFAILEVLLRGRGRVVSRPHLLREAWGDPIPGSEASLEVLIARLRRKLSTETRDQPILTHRGYGYSIRFRHEES